MTERGALELAEADEQQRFRLLRLYQDSVRRERESSRNRSTERTE